MAAAVHEMGYRGHLYGPDDLLTLLYLFQPNRNNREDDKLAARALIYSKLIIKEELVETTVPYSHTRDEVDIAATVQHLSLEDCCRLFPLIRWAPTDTAKDLVRHYLHEK